jgi:hypothetical protein
MDEASKKIFLAKADDNIRICVHLASQGNQC